MSRPKAGILYPSPPAYSFKSSRKDSSPPPGPGPLEYDVLKAQKLVQRGENAYSFPRSDSIKLRPRQSSPGPNQYDVNKSTFSTKGARILKANYSRNQEAVPGVGSYSPFFNNYPSGVKILKGNEPDPLKVKASLPSPGQYHSEFDKGQKGPSVIFNKSKTVFKDTKVPGPGSYQVEERKRKPKGPVIGTSGMFEKSQKDSLPGPGAYIKSVSSLSNVGISISKRYETNKSQELPGPGDYFIEKSGSLDKLKKGPHFGTASRKLDELNGNEIPGPGSYKVPDSVLEGHSSVFGKAGESILKKERLGVPGPGSYELPKEAERVGVKFPKSQSLAKVNAVPGPGEYESWKVYGAIDTRKGISIPKAKDPNQTNLLPGPGAYDPKKENYEKGKYTIGKAPKDYLPGMKKPMEGGIHYDIPSTYPDWPKYLMPGKK